MTCGQISRSFSKFVNFLFLFQWEHTSIWRGRVRERSIHSLMKWEPLLRWQISRGWRNRNRKPPRSFDNREMWQISDLLVSSLVSSSEVHTGEKAGWVQCKMISVFELIKGLVRSWPTINWNLPDWMHCTAVSTLEIRIHDCLCAQSSNAVLLNVFWIIWTKLNV